MIATTRADAQVKFGVRFGPNTSSASINRNLLSAENRTGFILGPTLDAKIPILGLGFDLSAVYDHRIVHLNANEESGMTSGTKTFKSLDIPLNIKWTLGNDKSFSVYGATGPQVSWNLDSQSLKGILDVSQYKMKNSYFSWNIGAGLTFLNMIRLSYNYNIGIGNTAEINFVDEMGEVVQGHIRNHTHQFFLTYFF